MSVDASVLGALAGEATGAVLGGAACCWDLKYDARICIVVTAELPTTHVHVSLKCRIMRIIICISQPGSGDTTPA